MPSHKAMGKDPLDWLVESQKDLPPLGFEGEDVPPASSGRSPALSADSGLNSSPPPGLPGDLPALESLESAADSSFSGGSSPLLPVPGETVRTALERDLLLYGAPRLAAARANSSQSTGLLALIALLVVSLIGGGLYLFHRAESGWETQLSSLDGAISGMERERENSREWVNRWMEARDDLLEARSETIQMLRTENRSLREASEQERDLIRQIEGQLEALSRRWERRLEEIETRLPVVTPPGDEELSGESSAESGPLPDAVSENPERATPSVSLRLPPALRPVHREAPRRPLVGPPDPR